MQYTPHQLKEKLLEGLDEENNVVDMGKVLDVLTILEKYPITREALEQTRIGRSVNELRRKTTNDQLAKRAKRLVRSWQKVVNATDSSTMNGERVNNVSPPGASSGPPSVGSAVGTPPVRPPSNNSPALSQVSRVETKTGVPISIRPRTPNSVKSSLSPQVPSRKPATPSLPQQIKDSDLLQKSAKRCASSPQLNQLSAKRPCISPQVYSQPGTPDSYSSVASKKSSKKDDHINSNPNTPLSGSVKGETSNKMKIVLSQDKNTNSNVKVSSSSWSVQRAESASLQKNASESDQNGMVNSAKNNGQPSERTSRPGTGYKSDTRYKSVVNGTDTSSNSDKNVKRTSPASRSETVSPTPSNSQTPKNSFTSKRNVNLPVKADLETPSKDRSVSLTPKVKNTAELIQSLRARNESFSVGNDVVRQIQTNQIEREADAPQSVVPEGARPRYRKKPGIRDLVPPSTSASLSKTKTEMVEKFLQTAVTSSSAEDLSPLKYDMSRAESPGTTSTSFDDSIHEREGITIHERGDNHGSKRNLTTVSDSYNSVDQTNLQSVIKSESAPEPSLSLEEIYSRYPTLDLENFQVDEDVYEAPEPLEVTDNMVQRLHDDNWTGVNGCFDREDAWHDWTQTLSLDTYSSDLLHVLPYVVIDD